MTKLKALLYLTILLIYFLNFCAGAFAKEDKHEIINPVCTPTGEIGCSEKGFNPACPKTFKPSCVFLGTKQYPACLSLKVGGSMYNYNLENITCKKTGKILK